MKKYLSSRLKAIPENKMIYLESLLDKNSDFISLAIGEPDFKTPWHVREEAMHIINKGFTFYSSIKGLEKLRQGISAYLKRRFNVLYHQEEILVTHGASEAIDLAIRALIDEGDEVIVVEPAYISYIPALEMVKARVKKIVLSESNNFVLSYDLLKEQVSPKTKALIINYPNNPTGAIMSKKDYQAIIPLIKENDILVIADEIYSELTYETKHFSIAEFEEIKDQVILISGFSKAFSMTGWRLGYMCGNKELINAMTVLHGYSNICASTISQFAGIEAVNGSDNDILKMHDEFEKRRNYLVSELNRIGLKTDYPKGAFYVFPNISSTGLNGYEFALKLAQEENVLVVPGLCYSDKFNDYIRISYAYSIEEIKKALIRIENLLKRIRSGKISEKEI